MTCSGSFAKHMGAVALLAALTAGGCNGVPADGVAVSTPDSRVQAGPGKPSGETSSAPKASTPSYVIGPMDLLQVNVFQAAELSKLVPVAEDGAINLPLIGSMQAAGKSTSDLEADIQKRLAASYLRKPQVSVMVAEYNSARVTVEGAVKSPGVFPLRGKSTLVGAIALAGGLDRDMSSDNVSVFRNVDGARKRIAYDLSAIRAGQTEDPEIAPGDVVVVEDSTAKVGFSYFQKLSPVANTGRSAVQGAIK